MNRLNSTLVRPKLMSSLWTAPRFLVHLKWEITQRIYMLTDF